MQTLGQFITENKEVIDKLTKVGESPISLIFRYEIYLFYEGLKGKKTKTEKYIICSEHFRVTERTVKRALNVMDKMFTVI